MKIAASVLLLLVFAVVVVPQDAPQEQAVHETREGYAACYALSDWRVQRTYREERPEQWADVLRRLYAAGKCWITQDGTRVVIVEEDRAGGVVRVRRTGREEKQRPAWLSWEAIKDG